MKNVLGKIKGLIGGGIKEGDEIKLSAQTLGEIKKITDEEIRIKFFIRSSFTESDSLYVRSCKKTKQAS